ncbi:MAG: PLP-dependent aminotransferase family protein [Anaerolineae bacterium]
MPKRQNQLPNTFYLSLVTVDSKSLVPLYRQIYSGLRDGILDGRLSAKTRLPSTRDLAKIWSVSRNTLRNAFDQLIAEGYLEAVVGHGTFVVELETRLVTPEKSLLKVVSERIRPISTIGRFLEPFGQSVKQSTISGTAFAVGVPDHAAFPHETWGRILNQCQRRAPRDKRVIHGPNGVMRLREAIASYLVSARGLHCTAEQIDIVPGSVSGMYVAALSLINQGDRVWMEEPGYINASGLLRYCGADLVPVPVDDQGLDVQAGIKIAPDARLAYVTPSHQYPLGVTLSLSRRQQLLDWAARNNSWIFEDDYDSAFRYDGPPLTALQGLDANQRVIYFGTFSKVMFPDLRLGYVVLPPDLVDVYTGVKLPIYLSSPTLIQEAVAEFMLEGHFVRHIRRMRQHYKARRDAFAEAIDRHMSGAMTLGATDCGLHAVAFMAEHLDEADVLGKAQSLGMLPLPLSQEYLHGNGRHGLVFGFSNVEPEKIEEYIGRLAAII